MFYLRKSYRIKADASRGDNVALDSRMQRRVVNQFLSTDDTDYTDFLT